MPKYNSVAQGDKTTEPAADRPSSQAERKRQADKLRQSEEQFRLLVEAVTEYAIFILDPEGRITSWNAGAERIKGYTEEEILGQHFSVFYTEEAARAGVPEQALEAAAREGQWTAEDWRLCKDGTCFWAHVTITALKDEAGALRGYAKVTRDLTEQKEHEDELAEQVHRTKQQNTLLRLMQTVASASSNAISLHEALQVAIDAVCEHTGWPVGHAYRLDEHEDALVPTGLWRMPDEERYEIFKTVTEHTRFRLGEGLPGQVAATGEPAWVEDVTDDPNFVRGQAADDLKVRGAFAFPVEVRGEVVAVLEFFSSEPQVPDEELLDAMGSVGMQLGRVAEREAAQKKLRESEHRYRRLFKASQEGIAITTPAGKIVDVNPAGRKILGYSSEELQELNVEELYINPEKRQQAAKVMAEEGVVRGLEVHLRRKGGEEIICQLSSTARRGPDGEVATYETFFRDVTEERQARETLEESEMKFRALAEESPTGITVIQDGRFKYVNETYAEIFGYDREEMIDTLPVETVVHPDDRSLVRENLRKRIEGEVNAVRFQARGLTKDQNILDLEVHGRRFTYRGRPAVIGSVLDVTERKRAQRALEESEAKFRALAEEAPVGILLIQDGRLQYANEALARMYGYPLEELRDVVYTEKLVRPSDRKRVRKSIEMRLSGERKSMQFRFRGLTREGETIYVEAYGTRIDYQGHPAIIGIDIDVTERLRLQREVLRAQEEERRRLGQDLHDGVASQLTGVAISLGLLARRTADDDDLTRRVQEIRRLVQESSENVRRLSHGLSPASLSENDLPRALEQLAENIEEGHFENESTLPDLQEDEAAQLYWIAQEATANARKYAEANRITIRLENEEDALVLEIEDDGKGFDPDEVEQGGLGLRSMRYRAELLGAAFAINSSAGEGTCVTCRLPV